MRYPGLVARVPSLRASDSDREQVAERLRVATGEGRLSTDELEERLGALYAARTYGELDTLTADLPVSSSPERVRDRLPTWAGAAAAITVLLAVLGALGGVRHSADAAAAAAAARHEQFRFPGLLPGPHHSRPLIAPTVALLTIVAVCAALGWLFIQSRPATDA